MVLDTPYFTDTLCRVASAITVAGRSQSDFSVDFVACANKQRIKGVVCHTLSGTTTHFRINFFADPESSIHRHQAIYEFHRLSGDRSLFRMFVNTCHPLIQGVQSEKNSQPPQTLCAPSLRGSDQSSFELSQRFFHENTLVSDAHRLDAGVVIEMIRSSEAPKDLAKSIVRHPSGVIRKLVKQLEARPLHAEHPNKVAAVLKTLVILAGVSAIPDLSPLSSLVGMLSPDNGLICSYLDHGFRRNCLEILAETAAHFLPRLGAVWCCQCAQGADILKQR